MTSAMKKDDARKKALLLGYIEKTRNRFMGILVAAKWAADKQEILGKTTHVTERLHEMQWELDAPPNRLFQINAYLRDSVRAPIYDVPAALEVLGTGGFAVLPQSIFPEEAEVKFPSDLLRMASLECSILAALFDTDLPEGFTQVSVEDGLATLSKPREFSVQIVPLLGAPDLESASGSRPEDIKWAIVSVNLLVKAKSSVPIHSGDYMLEQLRRKCQIKITGGEGLQGVFDHLQSVSTKLQIALLAAQSKSLREKMRVTTETNNLEIYQLTVAFWNGNGKLEIRPNPNSWELEVVVEEEVDQTLFIDASDLDLASIISSAITAKSYKLLADISACCPAATRHKLIFEACGVSLWLSFVSEERWCRIHVDSKTGELILRFSPSLQSPLTEGKNSRILLLFSSAEFSDKVLAHRLLQCKSTLEHSLLSLPMGLVDVVSHPNGISEPLLSNAFFLQDSNLKRYLLAIESVPLKDATVTLTVMERTAEGGYKTVSSKETSEHNLKGLITKRFLQRIKLLTLIEQLARQGFTHTEHQGQVMAQRSAPLFHTFDKGVTISIDANGQEVSIEFAATRAIDFNVQGSQSSCPLWVQETTAFSRKSGDESGKRFVWTMPHVTESTIQLFMAQLEEFSWSVRHLDELARIWMQYSLEIFELFPIFGLQPAFSGVWVFFGPDSQSLGSFKLHGRIGVKFIDRFTSFRCLPDMAHQVGPFLAHNLKSGGALIDVLFRGLEAFPMVHALGSHLFNLQNNRQIGYEGECILIPRGVNDFVLRYGHLFGVRIICVPYSKCVFLSDAFSSINDQTKHGPRSAMLEWSTFLHHHATRMKVYQSNGAGEKIAANTRLNLVDPRAICSDFSGEFSELILQYLGSSNSWMYAGQIAQSLRYSVLPVNAIPKSDSQWIFTSPFGLVIKGSFSWNPQRLNFDVSSTLTASSALLTPQICQNVANLLNAFQTNSRHSIMTFRNLMALFSANASVIVQILEICNDGKVDLYHVVEENSIFAKEETSNSAEKPPESPLISTVEYPDVGMPASVVDSLGNLNFTFRIKSSKQLFPVRLSSDSSYSLWIHKLSVLNALPNLTQEKTLRDLILKTF